MMGNRHSTGNNKKVFLKRTNQQSVHQVLPGLEAIHYVPEPHPYIRKPEKKIRSGGNMKLSFEQVTEMRKWYEEEGFTQKDVFEIAVELGWPVKNLVHVQHLLWYMQRVKR